MKLEEWLFEETKVAGKFESGRLRRFLIKLARWQKYKFYG